MRNKLLLSSLMVLIASTCFAQVKFSLQGGTSLTGITGKTGYEAHMGYRMGINVDFPTIGTCTLQTGLQILNRSYVYNWYGVYNAEISEGTQGAYWGMINSKINAVYLQIPLKLVMSVPFNKRCSLLFNVGPYVAYGISGESKLELASSSLLGFSDNISDVRGDISRHMLSRLDTFGAYSSMKRLDVGLGVGADFKYKFLFAGFGAEYGFIPVDKEFPQDAYKYMLGKSKKVVSPHNFSLELHIGFSFYIKSAN